MNINKQFESKYLAAADVPDDGDLILTISSVVIENLGQGEKAEPKPVIYFTEIKKGMACNKTNATTISGLYGAETDGWLGKKIAMFATEVDYQGKLTMAIRVRMKAPKAAVTAAPAGNGNGASGLWDRWFQLGAEAFEFGLDVPDLDHAASDAEVIKAGKALKASIAAAKELAASGL